MPIKIDNKINLLSEQQFYEIDYHITGLAYEIHNEIGRLWNEDIYQHELANRCLAAGYKKVEREKAIVVSHNDFIKNYYIDLLIEDSIIYELKAVSELSLEHDKQTLTYLFLSGLQHAKLINFRPQSVQKRFISTTLCFKDRYDFIINDEKWVDLEEEGLWLKEIMIELLQDWGAYLETNLFYEAINQFRGGEDNVIKKISIIHHQMKLGEQKIHLLNPRIAFKITALTRDYGNYEHHLRRFISLTSLNAIQWINFDKNEIVFKTIKNNGRMI